MLVEFHVIVFGISCELDLWKRFEVIPDSLSPRQTHEARCEGRSPERERVLMSTCVESHNTRGD